MKITSEMIAIAKAAALETYKAILKSATFDEDSAKDPEYYGERMHKPFSVYIERIIDSAKRGSRIEFIIEELENLKAIAVDYEKNAGDVSNAADKKDPKDKDKGTCPTGVPLCS